MPSLGCGFLLVKALKTIAWRFYVGFVKFALVMQCWQTHSKGESIIGLIYKIVGCPDCDIHLFGRQYSCNPYRESIILNTKADDLL